MTLDLKSRVEQISEWAYGHRYIPAGQSEMPGLIRRDTAPHLDQIMDCAHPDSPLRRITVMKGTQALVTSAVENVIGHSIKYKLHNILYIISSLKMGAIRSSTAIDALIDYSGLENYVKPISQRMKHKTGDKTFYKEFHGNRRLMITSYKSIGDAKSLSWDLIVMDELEEAKHELAGQGDPEKIFEGRSKTIRDAKIFKISTPTYVSGRINTNFVNGDQNFFFCKCPHCGEGQVLEIKGMGRDYGLYAQSERHGDKITVIDDTVKYICKFCGKDIYEYQKGWMMENGVWVPTAKPADILDTSFHVSNLMSPVVFYSWTSAMKEFAATDYGQRVTLFKNFTIDVLGMPWESRSEKKQWKDLKETVENYEIGGHIPPGGLVVTGGADVQKRRIELQVVVWGRNMESWVIDYKTFFCPNDETTLLKNGKVWNDFYNYIMTKKYTLEYQGLKKQIPVASCGVDSGYNPTNPEQKTDINTEVIVYDFVARNASKFFAVRGNPNMKGALLKEERVKRRSPLKVRYDFAVSEMKDEIFIKIDLSEDSPGRLHFSSHFPDEYFKGFCSEVFKESPDGKGWGWFKTYERNEPLDTWIYARAGAEKLNCPAWAPEIWDGYEKRLFGK